MAKVLFPGRTKMYCFTPLINRAQNYSLRLCLKCVLPTGMSHVSIISSVTRKAWLYSSKWFSLENSNTFMENSTLRIICQRSGHWSKRALEGKGKKQRLEVSPCDSQGPLLRTRADFSPGDIALSQPCVLLRHAEPVNQMLTPEVVSFKAQLPLTKCVTLKGETMYLHTHASSL